MKMKICNFFNISFHGPKRYVTGALIFADHKYIITSNVKHPEFPKTPLLYPKLGGFTQLIL